MTKKQERILESALTLFAERGYASTSTSSIAQNAGVSEGLIFRHYGHKEGLLRAVMELGMSKLKIMFADIAMTPEPREVIRKTLELPFTIDKSDYYFWRLTYALKWQSGDYYEDVTQQMKLVWGDAFKRLGYDDPKLEAELLMAVMDGLATSILLHPPTDLEGLQRVLKARYDM